MTIWVVLSQNKPYVAWSESEATWAATFLKFDDPEVVIHQTTLGKVLAQ